MNIFESHSGVAGQFDPASIGGSVESLLTLARDIRLKLGQKGYLLDSYISQFLEAANAMLAYDAANEGFDRSRELRSLCSDVLGREGIETDHLLYDRTLAVLSTQTFIGQYQENGTKLNLLYASLADEYLSFIMTAFLRDVDDRLRAVYDVQEMKGLYVQISGRVGEPVMEMLNLKLKQRFLIAPLVTIFAQGLTNDLAYCLLHRDWETNKQVFQLLLEGLPV